MEHTLSSLTFKGSIPQAIAEAKKQRKLFVVYMSGENAESSQLQQSTWTNIKVAESVSKYCILLHISEGSADAAHFSAIYPQKSIPCITAVGYIGVQLWQSEGFVGAEDLVSSLEKAWLSLHIQQTTTTLLSAALSPRKPETSTSGDSNYALHNQESSSGTVAPSCLSEFQGTNLHSEVATEVKQESKSHEYAVASNMTPSKLFDAHKSDNVGDERSTSDTSAQGVSNPTIVHTENSGSVSFAETIDNDSVVASGGSKPGHPEANMCVQYEKYEPVDDIVDTTENHLAVNKSTDAFLNIRLPDGVSLQAKFSLTSTLRMVKDYVDETETSRVGSYDLAIPYPRKVFNNQDLNKSLLELGLSGRQALILVPHQKPDHNKGLSLSENSNDRTDDSSVQAAGGYFSYVRRILSYFNPFSYVGGGANTSTSAQESQNDMWEYSPNPALQDNLREAARPSALYQPIVDNRDSNRNKQPTSRFGSNIHTLKHDEDDSQFRDRNSFWNGNSTQYGGDNGGR